MKRLSMSIVALALSLLAFAGSASAADEFDQYAIESTSIFLSSAQAGAHADLTVVFKLTQTGNEPFALTRDIEVALPPGVIGNPQGIPRCSVAQLGNRAEESECPIDSQVGITEVTLGGSFAGSFTEPIYNMKPPGTGDVVARLGFFAGPFPSLINVRVDPIDYSLVATIESAPSAAPFIKASTTLWGVPAAESHDLERLTPFEALQGKAPTEGRPAGLPEAPFMSNPVDCSLQRQISVTARSYQLPSQPSTKTAPYPQIISCGTVGFEPTFTIAPTNPEAAAPTGVDATLTIPQDETPQGRATSSLKSAVVTLPEGFAINPSAGDGLAGCSAQEVGFETTEPSHCPDAAKIGEVELDVPALEKTLNGSVYQRTPEEGKLFRFWVVTDEQGVHLKLPAEIDADKLTGQLTTVFSGIPSLGGNPQVPFAQLRLHVFGGPRAPLSTPTSCGTYQTAFQFTPWSGNPASEGNAPMEITSGCGKGGFAPGFAAGMRGSAGGEYGSFGLTLTRQDGEANPQAISVHLPQGLLAKLGGVPLCSDADAATGACPAGSQIGTVTAAAGVGGAPLWIPQPGKAPTAVYLAGPYKGAPYSVVAVVPAQAGPFDLGTVVNRSGIYVDPETTAATITTDPLPQILEGVPISYRTIHVDITREKFTLNPTDCDGKQISADVTAAIGAGASLTTPFQATSCARLPYSPHLKLTLKGQVKRTGHPAVNAVLTQPAGQANTQRAVVVLPPSEFIDQNHINNPCTRVQFAQNACPPLSVLGTATATTPLLDQPLSGPVYFRSNGGERELPDVVADLHGPIHVILVGFVDAVHKKGSEQSSIRTTFADVPDAPVTRFEMSLFGGKKRGLLVNSKPLCKTNRRYKLSLSAQNGAVERSEPKLGSNCGKKGKKK